MASRGEPLHGEGVTPAGSPATATDASALPADAVLRVFAIVLLKPLPTAPGIRGVGTRMPGTKALQPYGPL